MNTIPPDYPMVEHVNAVIDLSNSLRAEYEAAVTAYKEHAGLMGPTRQHYKTCYIEHKKAQADYVKITNDYYSHRTTYLRHKQYFGLVSNDLLASNIAMRSTTGPIGDLQALTHATLFNDFRNASHTFMAIIVKDKRLARLKENLGKLDRDLGAKCEEIFKTVDKDIKELERLHFNVTKAEAKMGGTPECGSIEGKCVQCMRIEDREAEEAEKAKKKKMKMKKRVPVKDLKKGLEEKGRLESIPEEEEFSDRIG